MLQLMQLQLTFFKGKKGNIISRLPSGKIVLPVRGFNPSPGEKWVVEIIEKERYAVAKPVSKIVTKKVRIYKKFKCGHKIFVDTETREVPENEPTEEIIEMLTYCEHCLKKLENADLNTLTSIDDIEAAVTAKNRRLMDRIYELSDKIYKLQQSIYITENRGTKEFECRYCNSKIPLHEGQLVCPSCGAEYSAKVETDVEQGFWEKTWIHQFWSIIDHQRQHKVQKEIEKIEKEILNISKQIDDNLIFLEQKYKEELRKLGVKEVRYDIGESGYGKVIVVFKDGKKLTGEFDEGIVIGIPDNIAAILEKLPVKSFTV